MSKKASPFQGHFGNMSSGYLEFLYESFLKDPSTVDASFHPLFYGQEPASAGPMTNGAALAQPSSLDPCKGPPREDLVAQTRAVAHLLHAYEAHGHRLATLDPLGFVDPPSHPDLDPKTHGLDEENQEQLYYVGQDHELGPWCTLAALGQYHQKIYGGPVGVEYAHLSDVKERAWVKNAFEKQQPGLSSPEKKDLLNQLIRAESFEKFLGTKFPGAKRFGLEGGESLIPLIESLIETGVREGLKEVVIGMAHRGRLNVLANILEKPLGSIFCDFQGLTDHASIPGSGDVKYHMGLSRDRSVGKAAVHLSLTANPSHLEAVNPVVLGKVRAKQRLLLMQDTSPEEVYQSVLGLLIHGDAAFAGQGIVAEGFTLSSLPGYRTGGTIHIIVNNQIGFTTDPDCGRSSTYCSDMAKVLEIPIFHVNGDDPEAVLWVGQMASAYRQTFHKDVIIDLYCYRRNGHNEMDEPSFTQPIMYEKIRQHPSTMALYAEKLTEKGIVSREEKKDLEDTHQRKLQEAFEASKDHSIKKRDWLEGVWSSFTPHVKDLEGETGVSMETLEHVSRAMTTLPKDFSLNRKLDRLLKSRQEVMESKENMDWATAEAFAFGSLLKEGYSIRLSGQDCGRGTFSHRHMVLTDQKTGEDFIPLDGVRAAGTTLEVVNSPLAEVSVLGFEHGYSLSDPKSLVLWEAQFGDFANGAQVMVDQFISSSEAKWMRLSGLVLLLPHGYEGQGPEHSSARFERYLQLCGDDNMIVANCTTAANYFHILRRQMVRPVRKPLILMTPKSLLRDAHAFSPLKEIDAGTSFQTVIPDDVIKDAKKGKLRRIVLCTGKVAYDVMDARDDASFMDVAVIRVEQLHPFPGDVLKKILKPHGSAQVVWCQEEPENMGAWTYVRPRIEGVLEDLGYDQEKLIYAGRPAAASPATGYLKIHQSEQERLVKEALGTSPKKRK